MPELTKITIYHLQMTDPEQFKPAQRSVADFAVRRAEITLPALNRFLYASVGAKWLWYERLSWSYEQWVTYLDRPEHETWIGYVRGTPAGYFELEHQANGSVEIVYFGLLPEFIGQGIGGQLLSAAIQRGWTSGAQRVWVHTCTLDHEHAINNYKSRGFSVFKIEEKEVKLPNRPEMGVFDPAAPLARPVA